MLRALPLLATLTALCGCLGLPYDAAPVSQDLAAPPAYLTSAQLAALNARPPVASGDPLADAGNNLRDRADAMRAQ
jgi:hypothetical protein